MSIFSRSSMSVVAAVAFAGGVVASCTFSPGPVGSGIGTNVPGQPGTGGASSNPFGATSGTAGSGSGGSGTGTPPSLDGPNCGLQQYGLQNVPPDLLIILDKSGSMNEKTVTTCMGTRAMPCPTKWPEMTTAINTVVGQTQASIRWGLKYFPDAVKGAQCEAMAAPVVPIGANSGAAIMMSIAGTQPGGRTPTATALMSGAAYLTAVADANPKYILLATDGLPNCGANAADNTTDDSPAAIAAVMAAAAGGIPVFVVGVGDVPDAVTTLNSMAVAGGRPRNDPMTKYYPVSSGADLVSVLTMIGGQIATCTFGLGKAPPDPKNIAVYGDGVRLPQSSTDGWNYGVGMTSIELFGATCDKVKAKQIKAVQAVFGCPGMPIP